MVDPWQRFKVQRFMEQHIWNYFSCGGQFSASELRVFPCECECGGLSFYTIVAPDLAARRGRFLGQVNATCVQCGLQELFLSVMPEYPDTGDQVAEVLKCECGGHTFNLGMGELFDEGFFDMGVVVSRCTSCREARIVVETD